MAAPTDVDTTLIAAPTNVDGSNINTSELVATVKEEFARHRREQDDFFARLCQEDEEHWNAFFACLRQEREEFWARPR